MADDRLKIHGVYRHFKGKSYIVENLAEHSETGEELVLYRQATLLEIMLNNLTLITIIHKKNLIMTNFLQTSLTLS